MNDYTYPAWTPTHETLYSFLSIQEDLYRLHEQLLHQISGSKSLEALRTLRNFIHGCAETFPTTGQLTYGRGILDTTA